MFNDENVVLFENVTKENLLTYINKYISDTIYILQFQLNSFLSNNNKNNSLKYNEEAQTNIDDKINIIKKINISLEKELFSLNNSKIKDISKIIQVLCKRNELLNNLINYFFTKQKILQSKELSLNKKLKNNNMNYNNNTNIKNNNKNAFIINEYPKINLYIENIKRNNEYNYNTNKISATLDDEQLFTEETCFKNPKQYISLYVKNPKHLRNTNKSLDNIKNNSSLTIINNEKINFNGNNSGDINMNNFKGKNEKNKMKRRKVNSVLKTLNSDLLITKIDKNNNNKSKFNIKNIYQLNKLNLEKLNDISSNLLLVNHQKKHK